MTDTDDVIREVRRLDAEATSGPWFYNSYSTVFSEPASEAYEALVQAIPDDAPDEAWEALPAGYVASVPVVGGDTATAEGSKDAALIAHFRTAAPLLAAEVERLRAENAARREELRLAQCPNPRDPEYAGHCETCSGLSVARTRRLAELEAENAELREALVVAEQSLGWWASSSHAKRFVWDGREQDPNGTHHALVVARAALAKGGGK
jgi:hypothetical protein